MQDFHGTLTAIVTPMTYGNIDEIGLKRLIVFQLHEKVNGIISCGTTGESATITPLEHRKINDIVVQMVDGRVPVIAGTGSNSTEEAIELAKSAKESGVDAILSVAPYYNKPSQEGIFQHFAAIANAVDIPMFLYNIPSRTAMGMNPETIAQLSKISNIVGIKDATGDLKHIAKIISMCPKKFIVLSGDDFTTLPTIAIGGKGVISVVSNVAPRAMSQMVNNALKGDFATARQEHYRLMELMQAMFCYPSPAPAKKALELMKLIFVSELRLPMTEMDEDSSRRLIAAMKNFGLLV